MDRELVLAVLVALLCGGVLTAVGWYPTRLPAAASGRALERRAWRRLWVPFWPAALLFAALCGWALVEPASAERVPNGLLWGALPFAAVLVRAAWRAVRSLMSAHRDLTVGTAGLFRPRIILLPRIAAALDARALAAAFAHERAHARHRDPLRLWLAQLGSDVLWPWPAAHVRFLYWKQALELARDEEARLEGTAGADLAAAILAAVRLGCGRSPLSAATLGGDESVLEDRIAHLMRPLETEASPANRSVVRLLVFAAGLILAGLLGTEFGERFVRTFFAIL